MVHLYTVERSVRRRLDPGFDMHCGRFRYGYVDMHAKKGTTPSGPVASPQASIVARWLFTLGERPSEGLRDFIRAKVGNSP